MTQDELRSWFEEKFPDLNLARVYLAEPARVCFQIKNGPDFRGLVIGEPAHKERFDKAVKASNRITTRFTNAVRQDLPFGIVYYIDWAERYG